MAKEKFEISARYVAKGFPVLTIIDKQHVNLMGKEYKVTKKGGKTNAPVDVTYKAATQEHLKKYYELGLMKDAQGKLILDASGNEISNQKIVIKIKDVEQSAPNK